MLGTGGALERKAARASQYSATYLGIGNCRLWGKHAADWTASRAANRGVGALGASTQKG